MSAKSKVTNQTGNTRDRIRSAGLRATASRIATLEVVRGARGPVSHADVAEALKGQNIDRATVFRNLNDLTDAGLLHRTHIGRAWNFEDGDGHKGHHAHFVCSECGLIECLDDVEIKVAPKSSKARGVPAKNYSVELSGTCDDCV